MAGENPTAAIVNVAVSLMPEIVALLRSRHAADPNAPTPSDADVLEGLRLAVTTSIARDDDWLRTHPLPPEG